MEVEEFKTRKARGQVANRPGNYTARAHEGPRGRSTDRGASAGARSGTSQENQPTPGSTTDRIQ